MKKSMSKKTQPGVKAELQYIDGPFIDFFIHFLYKNALLFAFYTLCRIAADLFSLPAVYRTDCQAGSLIPRLF